MLVQKLRAITLLLVAAAVCASGWLLAASPLDDKARAAAERALLEKWIAADAQTETLRQLEAVKWILLRVEVQKRTLHIADTPAERSWGEAAEQLLASAGSQLSLRGLPVAEDAKITLDGKKVELKALHSGVNLSLKFAEDKPVVTAIEATTPPRAGYVVKEVIADKNTIVVTGGKDGKPLVLKVGENAHFAVGTLKDLKPGTHVKLHVEIENGEMVVIGLWDR